MEGGNQGGQGGGSRRRRGGGRGSGKGAQSHQREAPQHTEQNHRQGAVQERQQHLEKRSPQAAPAAPAVAAPAAVQGSKGTGRTSEDFLCPTSRYSTTECIHPLTRKALAERFGYDRMTKVQAATIPLAISGEDVLAKAQTGTGKTLAFLIPAIEQIVKAKASGRNVKGIRSIVLSPTRELAAQIHTEAQQLLTFHQGLTTACVYGGTSMNKDIRILTQGPDILVATPGRVLDHFKNTTGMKEMVAQCMIFTLDEADRMLEMGFRHDLDAIMSYLPRTRQTLLFSATVPIEIVRIAPQIMSSEFLFVDAGTGEISKATADNNKHDKGVKKLEAENPLNTAKQVAQNVYVEPLDKQFQLGLHLIEKERQEQAARKESYKIIAFFTTARQTQLWAELFNGMGVPVLEVHSRKSQAQRTKASEAFREGSNVIMFSSDVTARGMDYPDVSFVLQVGTPADAEQYVHRLGRTGRAGKHGHGSLVISPEEQFFLRSVEKLPVKKMNMATEVDAKGMDVLDQRVGAGVRRLSADTKGKAYQAWLGFYNGFCGKMRWSKEDLVRKANDFVMNVLLLPSPPALLKKTVGMMGLRGVPGLVIEGVPSGQSGAPGGPRGPPGAHPRGPPGAQPKRARSPPAFGAQQQQPPRPGQGGNQQGGQQGNQTRGGQGQGQGGRGGQGQGQGRGGGGRGTGGRGGGRGGRGGYAS